MTDPAADVSELFITGVTADGRVFRPSDWAERLCGVMACYRPEGEVAMYAHLGYSPYVKPTSMNGISGVLLNDALKDIEPKAYEFVLTFAHENGLLTYPICSLDDDPNLPG
jgi:hypothetical protein